MKRIHHTFLTGLLAAGLLAGCDKKLDIQPQNTVDAQQAIKTSADVQGVLVGAYTALGVGNFLGGNVQVYSELIGDEGNVSWTGTFEEFTQMYNKAIPVDNANAENTWASGYVAVNTANNVLGNLNLVDSTERERVEGEARFIRATAFFELVRLYARSWNDGDPSTNPGIPLVLTPTQSVTPESQVRRNSVAETYTQIIDDLTEAEELLPDDGENGFFATKSVATAMLARVYLQQGNYTAAADAANRVIESGSYSLLPSYSDVFPRPVPPLQVLNTNEDIFAIQVSVQAGANNLNNYFASSDFGGRGDIVLDDGFFELFEEGDQRAELVYDGEYTSKFNNIYGNVKVLRLAEMYLIRAEANLRSGTEVGDTPLNDVNRIRTRAGVEPLTQDQLTPDAVLLERRRELTFEGQLLHDLKRTQQSVEVLPYNSPKLILPIPQRERQANPNLSQNEGY